MDGAEKVTFPTSNAVSATPASKVQRPGMTEGRIEPLITVTEWLVDGRVSGFGKVADAKIRSPDCLHDTLLPTSILGGVYSPW